jgi:hypothetical protein
MNRIDPLNQIIRNDTKRIKANTDPFVSSVWASTTSGTSTVLSKITGEGVIDFVFVGDANTTSDFDLDISIDGTPKTFAYSLSTMQSNDLIYYDSTNKSWTIKTPIHFSTSAEITAGSSDQRSISYVYRLRQ